MPSALVIGAMAPDWPYFFPPFTGSRWTHAAYGPVSIDLVIGLAVFGLWLVMLRRPAVDLAPDWLLMKLPDDPGRVSLSLWMRAAVSVVAGAATDKSLTSGLIHRRFSLRGPLAATIPSRWSDALRCRFDASKRSEASVAPTSLSDTAQSD